MNESRLKVQVLEKYYPDECEIIVDRFKNSACEVSGWQQFI